MSAYRSPPARLAHFRSAYGGTGLSPPDYFAVALYFDVEALAALRAVSAMDLVIVADAGFVARAKGPIDLREWRPGRDRDHNEITVPFAGDLDVGARVRLRAGAELTPVSGGHRVMATSRYRLTLRAEGPVALDLEGPLDSPWATA